MNTLFISYNEALGPLVQSQGISYLKWLARHGVGCVLMSFEKMHCDRRLFQERARRLRCELNNDGIEWQYLRYHKTPPVIATLLDILRGIVKGAFIIRENRVDIIHCRGAVAALIGYILSRLFGKKFIFDERGLMAEEYSDGGMWKAGGLLYRATRFIEKRLLGAADAIVVLTDNIRDFLLTSAYLPARNNGKMLDINVIPCCVDLKRFNRSGQIRSRMRQELHLEDKFIFLYSGSLGTWYLLNEMIDFFAVAKTMIPHAHLLMVTHIGREMAEEARRRKKMLPGDITICAAEFHEMPAYTNAADAGIFFIRPVFSKRSSCPTKFAEYLACGLPVVLNAGIGDTDRVVKDYRVGAMIEAFNGAAYRTGIGSLLDLLQDREPAADRCCRTARDLFSLEAGAAKYFDIYHRLD